MNCPGPLPGSPQDSRCSPSAENLCTWQLPYPSAMKISPDGAMSTPAGRLNGPPPRVTFRYPDELKSVGSTPVSDLRPRAPIVISGSPSGVNFMIWPLLRSTTHTLSSGSTVMAWGNSKRPSPQDERKLPSRSNTMMGCSPRLNPYTRACESTATAAIGASQPSGMRAHSALTSKVCFPEPTVVMMVSWYFVPWQDSLRVS